MSCTCWQCQDAALHVVLQTGSICFAQRKPSAVALPYPLHVPHAIHRALALRRYANDDGNVCASRLCRFVLFRALLNEIGFCLQWSLCLQWSCAALVMSYSCGKLSAIRSQLKLSQHHDLAPKKFRAECPPHASPLPPSTCLDCLDGVACDTSVPAHSICSVD